MCGPAPGYIVIAMELAEASLLDLLDAYRAEYKTTIPTDTLAAYLGQAAQGLDFLNSRQHQFDGRKCGFQHGDIKPSNILVIGDYAKLADFGLSAPTVAMNNPYSKCGTLDFAAPEIHRGRPERAERSIQSGGHLVLSANGERFLIRRRRKGSGDATATRGPAPDLSLVTRSERRILERALESAPERRWESCEVLIRELHYAWIVLGRERNVPYLPIRSR